MTKAGFINFIGRPNVGKSTLLNMFIGEKIAIMSPKAQTTRTMIQAVKTTEQGQIIIIDTPGIHKPKDTLGVFMNDVAKISMDGSDIIAILLPADEKLGPGDQFILDGIKNYREEETKVIAIVMKIDLVSKGKLMEKLIEVQSFFDFDEIIPVSARKKDNLDKLESLIFDLLPESPLLFPEDYTSEQSDRFVAKEFVREKILHLTNEEIPHAVAVVIEDFDEHKKTIEIDAMIVVERTSQKGIIIGKGGALIKEIRTQAERDLKRHFGKKTYVNLWVKVEKNWRTKTKYIEAYGYDFKDYK